MSLVPSVSRRAYSCAFTSLLIVLSSLSAQQDSVKLPPGNSTLEPFAETKRPVAASSSQDYDNEVVTLEEFSVSSDARKDSYITSEATTGTRLGGDIVDLPYSVSVLSQEFADDFLLSDDDLMFFVAGSTVSGGNWEQDSDSVSLRGFSSVSLRDGFLYYGAMAGKLSTGRTEVMRGPASILYGRTAPGGIRNSITKKPRSKETYHIEGAYSEYSRRAGLLLSGPIINNKLYYLAVYEYDRKENQIDFYWNETQLYHGTLLYKPLKSTVITLTLGYKTTRGSATPGISPGGRYVENATLGTDPNGNPNPYVPVTNASPARLGWGGLPYFNIQGPDTSDSFDRYSIHFLLEQRISRNLSFRLSALNYDMERDRRFWAGGTRYYAAKKGILGDANSVREPGIGKSSDNYKAVQAELLSQFSTGKIQHKLLFLADYGKRERTDRVRYLRDANASLRETTRFLNIYAPDWGLDFDWSLLYSEWFLNNEFDQNASSKPTRDEHKDDEAMGFTASWAISLFKDKLKLMASGRADKIDVHQTNPYLSGNRTDAKGDFSDTSYSLCLNYKIIERFLHFYFNHSTSFNDNPGSLSIDNGTGNFIDPTTSIGYEFGFKGDGLLKKRLSYTLSAAQITQDNVRTSNEDYDSGPAGTPQYLATGKNRSRVIELSTSWLLSKELVFIINGSYLDTEVLNSDKWWYIGQSLLGASKWNFSATTRYSFPKTSIFKGFSAGFTCSYRSDCLGQYEQYNAAGKLTQYADTIDSITLFNAYISYKWANGPGGRFRSTIQLNCNNIADKNFIMYNGRWYSNGRVFTASYKLDF